MECVLFAIHNDMPGSDKELRVWGKCQAPRPGYELSLEEDNPGINPNPDHFVLKLVVKEPTVLSPEVITETKVEELHRENFDERTTVIVRGAEPGSIKIQHLH